MERRNSWTPGEESWLRRMYPDHGNAELSEMHAEAFPERPRRSATAINSRAKVMGLRKREGFMRYQPSRATWPEERVEWLRSFAPGHDIYEIIDEFERLYGIRLSKYAMKNAKYRYAAHSGTNAGQFMKGHEPANKGKTWDEMGYSEQARENMRRGQFKKGGIPHNCAATPVGAERVTREGYIKVKVADMRFEKANDNWRLKHNIAWEQANGRPVPPHHMVVFADRDRDNYDPDNLVLVPRRLWSIISRNRMAYHDRESLEACMAIAELDSRLHRARCAPRACKACGERFEPRYPHQRRCDKCLGRD